MGKRLPWKWRATAKQLSKMMEGRDFVAAQSLLAPLLETYADNPIVLLHAAMLAFEQQDYSQAENRLMQALQVAPDNPVLHLALGETLLRLKQHEPSLKALRVCLDLEPGHPRATYLFGLNCIALERMEEAAHYFEQTVRQDRDFALSRIWTLAEAQASAARQK